MHGMNLGIDFIQLLRSAAGVAGQLTLAVEETRPTLLICGRHL